jgi:hypothetical protein
MKGRNSMVGGLALLAGLAVTPACGGNQTADNARTVATYEIEAPKDCGEIGFEAARQLSVLTCKQDDGSLKVYEIKHHYGKSYDLNLLYEIKK